MDQNYIAPTAALKKLKKARSLSQTVYLYGATGYGKTELVRQYLSGRRYIYLSCEELPWEAGALPPVEPGRQNRRVVVIDDLHRLKSEELRRDILALEEREDIWLILISRSPLPAWLMPRHIKSVFVVISENDLRMGRDEITAYLDARGAVYYAEQTGRPYIRMETGLLSAITKERAGGPWQEELAAVLKEAEHYRFLRLITEEGAAVWPLLQREKKALREAGTLDKDWLRRLLAEAEEMSRRYPLYLKKPAAAAADFGGTALTILRLQADGLTIDQIAQELGLKRDNVKYHVRENFRKLNATNKAGALLAARGLGLL